MVQARTDETLAESPAPAMAVRRALRAAYEGESALLRSSFGLYGARCADQKLFESSDARSHGARSPCRRTPCSRCAHLGRVDLGLAPTLCVRRATSGSPRRLEGASPL